MSFRKVVDVYVVSYASSVGSGIIVAEYVYIRKFAYADLGDIRAKIIRNTVRIFADKSRRMSSDRVEIS